MKRHWVGVFLCGGLAGCPQPADQNVTIVIIESQGDLELTADYDEAMRDPTTLTGMTTDVMTDTDVRTDTAIDTDTTVNTQVKQPE